MVKYKYDVWGNVLDKNVLDNCIVSNHNPFLYKGYVYDEETKWYYLQSRYYIPEIGRFLSPDFVDYTDPTSIGGLNLYAYCNNDPVSCEDPSGSLPRWAKWVIGGVLLGISVAVTIATCGAAAGTVAATVYTIASGAMVSGITSAVIGAVAGGMSYENGNVSWDLDGAADGFMWGSITGTISGIFSSIFSNIGNNAISSAIPDIGSSISTFPKLGFTVTQGLINCVSAGMLTAMQGLITDSFTMESVLLSSLFGYAGGITGVLNYGGELGSFIVGSGLGIGEGSIGEIIELLESKKKKQMKQLRLVY